MTGSDRVQQVWALLRSYADWEPGITTWTGSVVRSSGSAGEAAGVRETCPHCDGTGQAGRSVCRFCKGARVLWRDPQTGRETAPPGAAQPAFGPREAELAVKRRTVRCDGCGGSGKRTASSALTVEGDHDRCSPCRGTGSVEIIDERATDASLRRTQRDWGGQPQDPGWWLPAALERKQAQWVRGSYPELEVILQRLEAERPYEFRLLDRHIIHPLDNLVANERVMLTIDDIVAEISCQMPILIRVPEEASRAWSDEQVKTDVWRRRGRIADRVRAERDDQLARLVGEGFTVGQAASLFRISERRVRQIVSGRRDALVATGPAS